MMRQCCCRWAHVLQLFANNSKNQDINCCVYTFLQIMNCLSNLLEGNAANLEYFKSVEKLFRFVKKHALQRRDDSITSTCCRNAANVGTAVVVVVSFAV